MTIFGSPYTSEYGNWAFQVPSSKTPSACTRDLGWDPSSHWYIDYTRATVCPSWCHWDGCRGLLGALWAIRPALHVFEHIHGGHEMLLWDAAQKRLECFSVNKGVSSWLHYGVGTTERGHRQNFASRQCMYTTWNWPLQRCRNCVSLACLAARACWILTVQQRCPFILKLIAPYGSQFNFGRAVQTTRLRYRWCCCLPQSSRSGKGWSASTQLSWSGWQNLGSPVISSIDWIKLTCGHIAMLEWLGSNRSASSS